MSTPEERPLGREPASYTIAGFLSATALFAGLVALVYYPGRVGPAAMFVALLAAAMGGFHNRFAAWALVAVTASWFFGMVLAVVFERPIF